MRYRKLDANGDRSFGHGQNDIWQNVPDAVGQAIKTRLLLYTGEWFLDLTQGTPWGGFPLSDTVVASGRILGEGTRLTRDIAIRQRVLDTQGVLSIRDFKSSMDPDARVMTVSMKVNTIYGGLILKAAGSPSGGFEIGVTPLGPGGGGLS